MSVLATASNWNNHAFIRQMVVLLQHLPSLPYTSSNCSVYSWISKQQKKADYNQSNTLAVQASFQSCSVSKQMCSRPCYGSSLVDGLSVQGWGAKANSCPWLVGAMAVTAVHTRNSPTTQNSGTVWTQHFQSQLTSLRIFRFPVPLKKRFEHLLLQANFYVQWKLWHSS